MQALGSLFEGMTLLVTEVAPTAGGLPLPSDARVVPLKNPAGHDARRKLSLALNLPYYIRHFGHHCRDADVVHLPLPGDFQLLGFLIGLSLKKRVIARYCGSWNATSQTTVMNRITRSLMRRSARSANVMLATGEGAKPPAEGMHWIFATALSQAELAGIQPALNRPLGVPPQIVYAGRLSPEKGVGNLIRAIARLKQESFRPLPFVRLAGEGPERNALEALADEVGCRNQIEFMGQLDRGHLSAVFLDSDFCVQPSLTEGYSKAWLDAMAHGLPVVASEVGAARSVLGEDGERGWLVPPGQVSTLTDTLKRVTCGKVDWPALRTRCRSFVEGRTLEAWARKIGSICAEQWGCRLEAGKLR
jgi:glycosyltransferase involved in cell wall biosynthesis